MISLINIKRTGVVIATAFLFCLPISVEAQGVVNNPSGGSTQYSKQTGITYDCSLETGSRPGECTFQDLIIATRRVINWGTLFALAFSVVVIAVAGGRYMISGDNAGERTKANNMLLSVVKGIAFILTAWLIVTLITNALGVNSFQFTP